MGPDAEMAACSRARLGYACGRQPHPSRDREGAARSQGLKLPVMSTGGFSLITMLFLLLLVTALGIFLHSQVTERWRTVQNVESQLHSLVLAENGIEYARAILPHLDVNSLLRGLDGGHAGTAAMEWRNPMTFSEARQTDPALWRATHDDGLPFWEGQLLLPGGYPCQGGGCFFLRFSNNPEESFDQDEDGVVLVRSIGIVPDRVRDPFLPDLKNDVALVEARFRQERAFDLPSPLTLLGDDGTFEWEGDQFMIDGADRFGVSVVPFSQARLQEVLLASLSPAQEARIRGLGETPSVQDAGSLYRSERRYEVLFRLNFWKHFQDHLPSFEDSSGQGIVFLSQGGTVEGSFTGVLVARGDVVVAQSGRIEGILLHLGGGRLVLSDNALVIGGVWMSNLDHSGSTLQSLPLALRVGGSAQVIYNGSAIQRALGFFPPTQLGWRILFPEMTL